MVESLYGVIYYGGAYYGGTPINPDISQTSLNTIDVEFIYEPKHLDPYDPTDSLNISNYSIVGPIDPERLIQAITYIGENTVRVWFDGPLVPGEIYNVSVSNVEDIRDFLITTGGVSSFIAFGSDRPVIPLRLETADSWDIKNPQVSGDAKGGSLGTFSVDDDGDFAVETRRSALRKRILRRCMTTPDGFAHLEGYGLYPGSKRLVSPGELRRLQQDAEAQVRTEPEVRSVRAIVSQPTPGVIWLRLKVIDRYGPFDIETKIRGEEE